MSLCAPKISRTWSAVTLRVRLVTYTMGFFTAVGLRRRLTANRRLRQVWIGRATGDTATPPHLALREDELERLRDDLDMESRERLPIAPGDTRLPPRRPTRQDNAHVFIGARSAVNYKQQRLQAPCTRHSDSSLLFAGGRSQLAMAAPLTHCFSASSSRRKRSRSLRRE